MRALIFTQFFFGLNRHSCVRRDYNFSITLPSRQMHGVRAWNLEQIQLRLLREEGFLRRSFSF